MPELELRLRELATEMAWPETPDIEAAVMARLEAGPAAAARRVARAGRLAGRAGRLRHPRRLIAALLAALVLIPVAGAVAFPSARNDVLEWLGVRHVKVERVPTPPPGARPELEDDLGQLVPAGEAVTRAGFEPLIPEELGPPDRTRELGQRISLVYEPRDGLPKLPGMDAGLIITQTRGGIRTEYLRKLVFGGTNVRRVDVAGRPGAFISGGTHAYIYEAPGGAVEQDHPLLAGPTLIWEQDGRVLRLEGDVDRATALRIARSMR